MIISNIQYYPGLPFEDYLQLPGVSFSSLKGEIPVSAGMALGTRVHQYLNEPEKYDWQQVETVKAIATAIRTTLGSAFNILSKEVAFTCDMHFNGMVMRYKGRADALKVGKIVVDYKVLAGSLNSACERFGYVDQISGYCLPNFCGRGMIISYNKQARRVEVELINQQMIETSAATFWNYQIVRMGVPENVGV